jgi:hypothetical protein
MFKSQQYRAKANEFGELVKTSTCPEVSREVQKLERLRFVGGQRAGPRGRSQECRAGSNHEQSRGAALAVEDEYVLQCLGAAISVSRLLRMRWLNGTMRKHRSRQRQSRLLQFLLHLVPAVAAFSARSKEMATTAAALS